LPFWIFKKESDEEKARKAEQQASVAALEAGDLPLIARRRLQEQVSAGSSFFTSTLSAKEYLLSKEAGYQILGPVMGSAFVRIPYQLTYPSSGELTKVTEGRREARRLAISRLAKEAEILGAHGVIGVKVLRKTKAGVATSLSLLRQEQPLEFLIAPFRRQINIFLLPVP
jgi:uncharacterized protein YbjQ (UPF0145 family)